MFNKTLKPNTIAGQSFGKRTVLAGIAAMAVMAMFFGLVSTIPEAHASAGWTAGKFSKTYDFNGQFYVDAGSVYNGVKSVAFWTKGTTYGGKVIDLNGSAYISISVAGVVSTTGFTSPTIYIDGVVGTTVDANWHYVAVTTGTAIDASAVKFGSVEANNLVGMLDDVKMFNYALSAREINEKYRQGSPSMAQGGMISDSSSYTALTVRQNSTGKIVDFIGDSITTGAGLALSVDGLTTGTGLDISSTSTAGGASDVSKLLNLARSGANANASHSAYGLYSSVTNTGTTSTNIGGYFTVSGATTSRGLEVAGLSSATSTGLAIGNLSGATANTGVSIGAISGTGAGTGISAGAISSTGANNYGLRLSTLTGGTAGNYQINTGDITATGTTANSQLTVGAISGTANGSSNYGVKIGAISTAGTTTTNAGIDIGAISGGTSNNYGINIGTLTGGAGSSVYGINTGVLTSVASGTNFQANLGSVSGASSATFGGIRTGAVSGAGTASYGLDLGANSSTAATNYGINIGAVSGAGTTNYGLYVGAVSGAGANYGAIFAGGNVGIGTATPGSKLEISENAATPALTVTQSGTGNIVNLTGDSITTGAGLALSVDGLTTGSGISVDSTSTAFNGGKLLNLTASGALGSAGTVYGVYSALTGANVNNTNVAGYFSASGAGSTNYGLIVAAGNVGIGTTFATGAPADKLTVAGGSATIYDTASLGSEKVTNGTFADASAWTWGTGWAHDAVNFEADHTVGNILALEQSVSAVVGEIYQVVFTVLNRTAGSVTPQVGGVNGAAISSNTTSTQQIRVTGTGNLKFTPTTDFDGSIDTVSVKLITGGDLKLAGLLTGGGTTGIKVTADGNVGIGTTSPARNLEVLDNSDPQMRLTNTATSYVADFQVDGVGDLTITMSGEDLFVADNLWVSDGSPAFASVSGSGNLIVENLISFDSDYRQGCDITYKDSNTITVGPGEVMIGEMQNKAEMRKNTASIDVTWADLDTGAEAAGTNYFVYAAADAAASTFTVKISVSHPYWTAPGFYNSAGSSAAPTGLTKYRLLGYFHNDAESNINRYSIADNTNLNGKTLAAGIPLPGMVKIPSGNFAVDIYEATANDTSPTSGTAADWVAVSSYNAAPWTVIQQSDGTRGDSDDAFDACENAGKRLISSEEWLIVAQQTPDPHTADPANDSEGCLIWNTGSDHTSKPSSAVWAGTQEANSICANNGLIAAKTCYSASGTYYYECACTGTNKSASYTCQSKYGVRDMIGNVWEWNSDTRSATDYPASAAWYAVTDAWFQPNGSIGNYAFTGFTDITFINKYGSDGVYLPISIATAAFLRGGDWSDGARAGVFSLDLSNAPSSSYWGIGFRCSR